MPDKNEELHELRERVSVLETKVQNTNERVESNHLSFVNAIKELVSKVEFAPVKMIAYGLAATIMSSVLVAILSKVISK